MNVTEDPIPAELMENLSSCSAEAYSLLGLDPDCYPIEAVSAVDQFAYGWQRGERPPEGTFEDADEVRLIVGSLWGEQLVQQFDWTWARLTHHDAGEAVGYGVFSPDRSLAIYPLDFVFDCMKDPKIDVTIMLSFNMLLEKRIPAMPARSYTNVMAGVRRTVPRAG